MEDKHFKWLCRILTNARARINTLETLFFHGESVDFWCFTDHSGIIKKHLFGEEGVTTYSEAVSHFLSRPKLPSSKPTTAICSCYLKGERILIESESMHRPAYAKNYSLQEYRDLRDSLREVYRLQVKYVRGKGYMSMLHKREGDLLLAERSPRLIHKARDAVQVVLSAVERVKLRRVVELDLEFLREEDGVLWLMNCLHCKVAAPAACQGDLLTSDKTDTKRPTKTPFHTHRKQLFNSQGGAKKCTPAESKYIFKRGQLRNRESNLNSPLRFLSPDNSQELEAAESVAEVREKPIDIATKSSAANSLTRNTRTDRFNNANFQELLLLNLTRRYGLSPRFASGEDCQHYLDAILSTNQPELYRSQTSLGKARLSTNRIEEPITLHSSNSDSSDESKQSSEIDMLPEIDITRLPNIVHGDNGKKQSRIMPGSVTERTEKARRKAKQTRKWSKSEYLIPVLSKAGRARITRFNTQEKVVP